MGGFGKRCALKSSPPDRSGSAGADSRKPNLPSGSKLPTPTQIRMFKSERRTRMREQEEAGQESEAVLGIVGTFLAFLASLT